MFRLNYTIIPEKNLIIEYAQGSLDLKQFIRSKTQIMKDKHYNSDYNVLSYICDTVFVYDRVVLESYLKFIQKELKNLGNQNVFVTATPMQVVNTLLLKKSGMNIRVFSSTIAAVHHLRFSFNDFVFIQGKIELLSETNN